MKSIRKINGVVWMIVAALLFAGCTGQPAQSPTAALATDLPATVAPAATATQLQEPTAAAPTQEVPVTAPDAAPTTDTAAPDASLPTAAPASAGEIPSTGESLRFDLIPSESKARYRVREQLVNLTLPNDAVGETDQVSGSITILPEGTVDTASSKFVVDLVSLVSDANRRDNFLRQNVLQTDQFPIAEFVPTAVSGLAWPLPESGPVNFQLIGDLTIRDVTREVTWDVNGTLEGSRGTVQAQTEFKFADFSLTQPRVPVVLSIEDRIILEVDGVLERSGAASLQEQDGEGQQSGGADVLDAPAAACTAPAPLTPPMTEGPYYKANAPERTSLRESGTVGTPITLTGYVLTTGCQPVANAVVDFWQTDGQGQYDNVGYGMRGQQRTDGQGRYFLETVLPGEYPGRTPHIHVKVQPPGGTVLTTQVFIPGAAGNATDRIFDPALLVTLDETGDAIQASFNFVVP